ncbi:MAG: hypothetical protein AB1626_00580 [Candidatus Micrarchaeota archaeon]
MDTISHVFWAWFLARKNKLAWLAAVGAVVPDLASLVAGAFALAAAGFDVGAAVQAFFATPYQPFYLFFHSVLVFGAIACIALALKRTAWPFFFGWGLHLAMDALTHVTDGIRPFWPLSEWQLVGPFSYWDFSHGAAFVIAVEAIALAAALWILWRERSEQGFNKRGGKLIAWLKKRRKKALKRRLRR